jgi:hypothetical protein
MGLRTAMNRLLPVGILIISTAPLFAQHQQQNVVIGGDKAKNQAYCQILDLIAQLNREDDRRKAKALSQKIDQLQKQLGPEFLAVTNGLNHLDLNSPDGREITSIISTLNQSCD